MELIGKRVVVYGGGKSGLSAYDLALSKGARAIIYDDEVTVPRSTNSIGVFKDADIVVLSPGVDKNKEFLLEAKLEGKLVISELELASICCKAEQIAITGTNGKTTTTLLVDHILKCACLKSYPLGNIGVAFSSIADRLDATEIAVLETSSFQLEGCVKFSPDIAVLLNVKPDHLERHGTFEKYVMAKSAIFKNQGESDYVVYNADDDTICALLDQMVACKVPFGQKEPHLDGAYISSNFVCFRGNPIISLQDISFRGDELQNVLAAVCVCALKGVSDYTIAKAISTFSRPEHRRQFVLEIEGISFFDDSKATNISACLSAISTLDESAVLILGGAKRRENFDELFSSINEMVKSVVVCGQNADDIFASAKKFNFENIHLCNDLSEAVDIAYNEAKEHSCKGVMFSPASKSFDAFCNFEERGRFFKKCVCDLSCKIQKSNKK